MMPPILQTSGFGWCPAIRKAALLLMALVVATVPAQPKPTTGYAPVNGLKMYYEVHGKGEPVVLLHGAFMTITTHVTLMQRMAIIVPMVNDFLIAKP